MLTASEATIVLRSTGSQVSVEGPHTFVGGYPISLGCERDGTYGEWRWDGQQLQAAVDRLGMFPLYYGELNDGIALSTSVTELVKKGVSPEIDWISLWLLFRWNQVSCQTVFKHIKLMPVGGKLTWRPGELNVTESHPQVGLNCLPRSAALDAYIDLFRQAIRRRIVNQAPIRLALSGGRDSRHIFLELVRIKAPLAGCYTSSHGHLQRDLEPAQRLCAAFNVPHHEAPLPEDTNIVAVEIEKNRNLNFQALEHVWVWLLAQSMADQDAISYDGIAGDVLSAGDKHDDHNSLLYRQGRFEELAEKLAPDMQLVLVPGHAGKVRSADAHAVLVRELLLYRNMHNPMMWFFLFNRTRRTIAPTIPGLYGRTLRAVYSPYLDRDLVDFLASLPEEMYADKTFHTQAIERAYPSVADIPYSQRMRPPSSLSRQYALQGMKFLLTARSSDVLDTRAALLRLTRCLLRPRHVSQADWIVQQSLFLHQLADIQAIHN